MPLVGGIGRCQEALTQSNALIVVIRRRERRTFAENAGSRTEGWSRDVLQDDTREMWLSGSGKDLTAKNYANEIQIISTAKLPCAGLNFPAFLEVTLSID